MTEPLLPDANSPPLESQEHVPSAGGLPIPPRRTPLNAALWAIAIGGAEYVVGSLTHTLGLSATSVSHKPFVDIPVVQPAGALGALPLDRAEGYAAGFEPRKDAHGTYLESSQDLARVFGAEIGWGDLAQPDPNSRCTHDPDDERKTLAWFCDAEPYLIHLNRSAVAMPTALYESSLVDVIKHELGHLIIHQRCGDTTPAGGTVEVEGVTSSYAVLYLGASRDALSGITSGSDEYQMTSDTEEVARLIQEDVCWYQPSASG